MGKPGVILRSQFTVPEKKSFSGYVKYMLRKEALLEKEKQLSQIEKEELNTIEQLLSRYDVELGMTYKSLQKNKDKDEMEIESELIMGSKELFHDKDYGKYISYMSRQYALDKKTDLTKEEEKEKHVLRKKISSYIPKKKSPIADEVIPGVFSLGKKKMTQKDLREVDELVKSSERNGSIFYQDVISFDTDFLVKEKMLNPETDQLDEKRIQDASRKMMEGLFKDEKMDQGFWFASIHRNTNHVHIHYGTVETKNTRPLITVKEDGIEYLEPKGKRKQSTIDHMKSTFTNALIDRTAELSRVSLLRNTLVQEIKETYQNDKEEGQQVKLINELYDDLPSNKKHWNYNDKHISDNTRLKINTITESLMKDNPNFKEYIQLTKEEGEYRKGLFGESKRENKDYEKNKLEEIQTRLGNSLLKEMKKEFSNTEDSRNVYTKENKVINHYPETKYHKPLVSRKNIYQMKRAIHEDNEKYRAEKDYERLQEQIAYEQQNRSL